MSRILLIEDDLKMQELIVDYLQNYKYSVKALTLPLDALKAIKEESFDIIILDLMLPQMDGFDLCKEIKKISDTPIIISSARGDIGNKIMGYELGADDYLAKPYEPRELILKIEAILRRYKKSSTLEIGEFKINKDSREVFLDDYPIDLTKVEFDIFLQLIKNRGSIVSREQLILASSLPSDTKTRSLDMHISNIRYKLGDDAKNPKYIKSVWGIGYKFL